jgi:hypothetical protein
MKSEGGIQGVSIMVAGSQITLDFTATCLNLKTLLERTEEILPLLHALVSADDTWFDLTNSEILLRGRAYVTMNMLCQSAMQIATQKARLLKSIADGSEKIADHGFPEFDEIDLYKN